MNPILTHGGTFSTTVEIPVRIDYRIESDGTEIVIEAVVPNRDSIPAIPFYALPIVEQRLILAAAQAHSEQVEREARAEARA